jgi:hypothetical protein
VVEVVEVAFGVVIAAVAGDFLALLLVLVEVNTALEALIVSTAAAVVTMASLAVLNHHSVVIVSSVSVITVVAAMLPLELVSP